MWRVRLRFWRALTRASLLAPTFMSMGAEQLSEVILHLLFCVEYTTVSDGF